MGLFGKSKKEKQKEAEAKLLKALFIAEAKNKSAQSLPTTGKSKLITKQCRYCGHRVTYLVHGMPPGTTCPKRGKGQPHVWQTLGYQYR